MCTKNRSTYACHHTIDTIVVKCYNVRNNLPCSGIRWKRLTMTTRCFTCTTPPL